MSENTTNQLAMAVDIITAYIGRNAIPAAELPNLITTVHRSLVSVKGTEAAKIEEVKTPAVSIKKSITDDHLVCLEDGRTFKSLKRHLRSKYNLSAEEYRIKWGLPKDYPMVAPNYSAKRSLLARQNGLGQSNRAASLRKRVAQTPP